ncbi:MAG: hypothetical protein ACFFG0_22565 [Candidatus Thorarchaeota archaeon]
MNSKKYLKKKIKKLGNKIDNIQDTIIGIMYFIMRMASTWDSNMDLIQKTFDMVAKKVNELEDSVNPLNVLDETETPNKDTADN